MDLTSVKTIKELLSQHGARASKGLGQNFLIDKNALEKIITTADLKPSDNVLEIGPGIGTLTQELAKNVKKVIAVEKDRKMCEILQETLENYKNVEVSNKDILKANFQSLKDYKIVANLPYYITSPVIRKFLERPEGYPNQPELMVLMVQKEVGQRICAKPPNMSLLAVSVQFYADPKIISYVSKNCFWPSPKVDSAIIKITPRGQTSRQAGGQTSPDLFFRVVKAGFSQPRKQLSNNLSKILKMDRKKVNEWLSRNNIGSSQRAETLSIENWKNLTNSI